MGRTDREDRQFGVTLGTVLILLGVFLRWRGSPLASGLLWAAAAVLLAFAGIAPQMLAGLRRAWLRLTDGLAAVMTHVVLAVVFFGVLTPLGVTMRLFGFDPLRRKVRGAASYWVPYPARQRDRRHYEKLY